MGIFQKILDATTPYIPGNLTVGGGVITGGGALKWKVFTGTMPSNGHRRLGLVDHLAKLGCAVAGLCLYWVGFCMACLVMASASA